MPLDKNMKILVVDDFATMRRILKNVLNQLDFQNVFEADDGSTAVEVLDAEKIDFVIADWNMPQMTGIDLLRYMRSKEELKDIPFLMVTAEGQQENVIEAVKAKVNDYVVKPFTAEKIGEKIEKIFS